MFCFEAIIKRWPFETIKYSPAINSLLHYAFQLRTIFASSAREYNERNFPQAQLVCKINARFLLHEHGDPHFVMHEFKLRERKIPFKNKV